MLYSTWRLSLRMNGEIREIREIRHQASLRMAIFTTKTFLPHTDHRFDVALFCSTPLGMLHADATSRHHCVSTVSCLPMEKIVSGGTGQRKNACPRKGEIDHANAADHPVFEAIPILTSGFETRGETAAAALSYSLELLRPSRPCPIASNSLATPF